MYGEALINYGPYMAPFAMIVIGFIFASLVYLDEKELTKKSLRVLFALITCVSMLQIFRGNMAYELKVYVYRIIVFIGLIVLYRKYYKTRKRMG